MAIQIIRDVSADVIKRGATRSLSAKQNDLNSRFLHVQIQEDGQDITVDPSLTVILNVKRSDKATNMFYGTVNDDGTVQVPLTPWMLELAGTLECDISIVSEDPTAAKLTTMQFNIYVEASAVSDENIVDTEEYNVLVDLLERTAEAEAEAKEAAEQALIAKKGAIEVLTYPETSTSEAKQNALEALQRIYNKLLEGDTHFSVVIYDEMNETYYPAGVYLQGNYISVVTSFTEVSAISLEAMVLEISVSNITASSIMLVKFDRTTQELYSKPTSGIPKTDLASVVKTSLDKADTAYQKPTGGIPKADLAQDVQDSLENVRDGKSAYDIAVANGYTGTESEWLASLHAANPKVLPMSQYATEEEALAYMDSQTDHSIIYVWNNNVYCYASKTVTQITGACLYGYRNSASSGLKVASGKSAYIIPVSSFAAPLYVENYKYPISDTPYIYGGTVIPTFNTTLISQDSWINKTDAFDISVEQLQGCTYVVFAVTTATQPSDVSVTINGTVIPLNVITSPSQIESAVGSGTTTVNGYTNSGVSYTTIVSTNSTQKYISERNAYVLPVPLGYCESHATFEAGTHYLTKYPYETMSEMFSALAAANSGYITETVLGKDQSNTYDIKSYVLDAPTSLSSGQTSAVVSEKPVFIITSGLHGLEPDAVHTVYHFMQDVAENYYESEQLQYLHDNVKFVIIPICNPWGYVNQNYHNSNDVDLNKNFECGYRTNGVENTGTAANSEAETQLMKQIFDAYPKAIFHLECHGKYGVDTSFDKTIWFSLMKTLQSELIELNANKLNNQIGRRLYKLGYETNHSTGGYITYYGLNGRPKDYTGTKYGILSGTMEGTGCIYSDTGYSVNTQKINCEALENFVLNVISSLSCEVKARSLNA